MQYIVLNGHATSRSRISDTSTATQYGIPSFDANACFEHCCASLLVLFLCHVRIINRSHVNHDSVGCTGSEFCMWGHLRANDVHIKGCTSSKAFPSRPPATLRGAMASSSDRKRTLPPPPPRRRPPPQADSRAAVPPPLSLEHLWQVRSGWDAKGPWVTLDVVTSRVLETQYQADNYDTTIKQADGSSYYYDMLLWEEHRPEEEYGRPLRRVPWSERFNEAWSAVGEKHALGGFLLPASESAAERDDDADDDDKRSDDEEICWQFRGGKKGNGKWKWMDDVEWLEAAYQNRHRQPVVRKTYDGETYEYNFTTMMQRNVTSSTAPRRAIRRRKASMDVPSD